MKINMYQKVIVKPMKCNNNQIMLHYNQITKCTCDQLFNIKILLYSNKDKYRKHKENIPILFNFEK